MNAGDIQERMEVVSSCGNHVGTVDRVQDNWLKLTKHDYAAGGRHHYVPLEWVASIDEKVHLNRPCDEAMEKWTAEPAEAGA